MIVYNTLDWSVRKTKSIPDSLMSINNIILLLGSCVLIILIEGVLNYRGTNSTVLIGILYHRSGNFCMTNFHVENFCRNNPVLH